MNTIIVSILSGIVASLFSVLLIELIKKVRVTNYYKKFEGEYDLFYINGTQVDNQFIEFKYIKSHLYKVTCFHNDIKEWESHIVMSSENMLHGEGIYSYTSREDFGIHNILIAPDHSKISVHYRNLSRPNGQYGGLIWKKNPNCK